MDDVALDLDALDLGQAAAPHLQRRDLLGLQVRAQLAVGRQVDEARDLDEPLEPALIEHRRLVDAPDERQRVVELVHPPPQLGVDVRPAAPSRSDLPSSSATRSLRSA